MVMILTMPIALPPPTGETPSIPSMRTAPVLVGWLGSLHRYPPCPHEEAHTPVPHPWLRRGSVFDPSWKEFWPKRPKLFSYRYIMSLGWIGPEGKLKRRVCLATASMTRSLR